MNHTTRPIYHSSTTFQFQGITPDLELGDQERVVRVSAMEDSSNGKVEETREAESVDECKDVAVEDVGDSSKLVQVESVKVLDINDENSEPASKRAISIIEEIVEFAEKLHDGDDLSSSSSSSGEEETQVLPAEETADDDQVEEKEVVESLSIDLSKEAPVKNVEKEEIGGSSALETEEKTLTCLVEDDVADLVAKGVEETKLQASYEKNDSPDEDGVTRGVSKGSEEETELPFVDQKIDETNPTPAQEVSKGIEESNKTGESSQAVYEAASENVDHNPVILENIEYPSDAPVTRASRQPTSWKSCCGLFEVLQRSDR